MDKEIKWTILCTKGVHYNASVDKVGSLRIRLSERSQTQKAAHTPYGSICMVARKGKDKDQVLGCQGLSVGKAVITKETRKKLE